MKHPIDALIDDARELTRRALSVVPAPAAVDWAACPAAVWQSGLLGAGFVAHGSLDDIGLDDLMWIDDQKAQIDLNTRQFLAGLPANNVLLWGSRGTGKSSLVHALLNRYAEDGLRLVEVSKHDLAALPRIVRRLRDAPYRFVLFCDDLSFEADDASYKELKSALEGSMFKTSGNVLIYATSNRRHLLPEYASDNQHTVVREGELHESEAVEEKISLSDRFGLWLSFYPFRQDAYLDVVGHWVSRLAQRHGLDFTWNDEVRAAALRWALARGVRSGRTAQHFARHWVGKSLLD
ncbi:MAG: AAA family ATPase [Gammaproteobacteria bacterium]|nr:AAA family ATPase [Gammaproteobacteria bacterium]|tara:strand:- start:5500 stop:6378 length:879 start_codon:yes stop_codon:yes gene_type:complete